MSSKSKSKRYKKSIKKKRQIKNHKESKNLIELLNISLKNIHSDIGINIFDKDDYILSSYLKQGIKRGWKVLNDKNIIKEVNCNSVCMTVSILNYKIMNKSFDKLNLVEKIYLFFISYLVKIESKTKKELTIQYAIRKIDMKIKSETLRYHRKQKERGETHKETRRSVSHIGRLEKQKTELLENDGSKDDKLNRYYMIDICNHIDCEYLNEYKMSKNEKWKLSFEKFCKHLTFIFKGVIWLNMVMYFEGKSIYAPKNKKPSPYYISPSKQILPLNIDIRELIGTKKIGDILLIPSLNLYGSKLVYNGKKEDKLYNNYTNGNYWVYKDLDITKKTIKKTSVKNLENKHYIIAMMDLTVDYKKSKNERLYDSLDYFWGIVRGTIPNSKRPVLKNISKSSKSIGGHVSNNLSETIENSITLHWLVIHKDKLNEYLKENVI